MKLLELPATELQPAASPVYSRLTDQTAPRTPLLAAAENGSPQVVVLLLQKGVPAGSEALPLAAAQGHTAVCAALLQALQADTSAAALAARGDALQQARARKLSPSCHAAHHATAHWLPSPTPLTVSPAPRVLRPR